MAAISHVFTIRRAAQILGRDEDLLWELSDQLEPEDGKLWVCDIDGAETPRLHPRWHRGSSRNYQGSDRSRRLISRRVYRGAQRMLTLQRLMPTLDLALGHRVVWSPADVGHVVALQPFRQVVRDIRGAIVGQQPWPMENAVEPRRIQRHFERGGDVLGLHRG